MAINRPENHTVNVDLEEYGFTDDEEVDVTGVYEPGEKQTREHPGCAPNFEVHTIELNGVDLYNELPDDAFDLDEIVTEILENRDYGC